MFSHTHIDGAAIAFKPVWEFGGQICADWFHEFLLVMDKPNRLLGISNLLSI